MKKSICLILIFSLMLSICSVMAVSAEEELIFPVSETTGKWGTSSAAPGYDGGKHQWSSEKGATFKIALEIPKAGNYELFFWKSVHENTSNEMPLYLTRNGKTEQIANINQKTGETGWASIGIFDFDGKSEAYVSGEVTKPTARVNAVKLEETTKPVTEIVIEMPEETETPAEETVEEPEITNETIYLSQEVKGIPDGDGIIFPLSEAKGKWNASKTVPGYDGDKHYYTYSKGASFKIGIDVPEAGNYEVFYWKPVHSNSSPAMALSLTHNGKTENVKPVDLTTGETGWESVGVFHFDDVNEAYLGAVIEKSNYRASAVRLVKTDKEVTEFADAPAQEEKPAEPEEKPEITEDTVYLSREVVAIPSEDGGYIFPLSEAKGKWAKTSSSPGYDGKGHYYSSTPGASFKMGIDVPEAGNYEVFLWNPVHTSASKKLTLQLNHNGKKEPVKTISQTEGEPGWVSLGVFNFDDVNEAYVGQIIESGMHRLSAVKLIKTDKEITTFEVEAPVVIDVEPYPGFSYPEYNDAGEKWWGWSGSLAGPIKNYPGSLWTTKQGATCKYDPDITAVGNVRVTVYKLWYKGGNDTNVRYDVHHNGEVDTFYIDTAAGGGDEWITLGDFYFAGTGDEYVELIRETETTAAINTRASAVRFDILSSVDNSIWNTIYITPNLLMLGKAQMSHLNKFADMDGHWAEYDVEYMADKKYINGKAESAFAPEDTITRAEATAILARSVCPEETDAPSYPDVTPDAWYYKTIASAKSYGLLDNFPTENGFLPDQPITREELTLLIYNAVQKSGKSFPWLDSVPNNFEKYADKTDINPFAAESFNVLVHMGVINGTSDTTLSPKNTATRAEAAALLKRYMETCVWSGPPAGQEWVMTFNDEFNGDSLNWDVWDSEHSAGRASLQSSRWRENAVVENGMLRLMTLKQERGGKHWTTASVWVKRDVFTQAYGYWEARYRYCAAQGINNAWWNRTKESSSTPPHGFEIDINEGHYPNKMNSTLHTAVDLNGNKASLSYAYTAPYDLSADFHTYAVEWTDSELIFYFDGTEVSRKPNTNATTGVTPWFSTAVMNWAGQISDEADGTSMDIQYVRLYQTKERYEAQQAENAEVPAE
ncbi:MAG: S-layer homology domain-containing protein [Clostridia bacterium]|nr:S-layer homology domain-containing protein [Clostridia bacterium]